MKASEKTMDTIVNLCKARGFIFPGSEIYGGLSNFSISDTAQHEKNS